MKRKKSFAAFVIQKILLFVISIVALSLLVFAMSRAAPGDPLVSYYGDQAERMSTEQRDAAMDRLGLKKPVPEQYAIWVRHALHGNFGISYKYKQDVMEVISGRLANTLILGGVGFVLTFLLALLLGIFCAGREGGPADTVLCRAGTVTSCIPEFWLSLILILVFSVTFRLLPSSGAFSYGQEGSVQNRILHMILPLTVIVLSHLWYYAYLIRNRLLEETRMEYVLLGKSMGLTRRQIMNRHCVRNILPAYISIMAISLPHVLEGTYIVEMVFSYPGLGTLSFESAKYHDYNMLMVLVILTGILVILGNITGQAVSERIDTRMKPERHPEIGEEVTSRE
ncbi:MAG TPA: peptide ABC transporter permease [Lachnospiraceae bacterium]|nr:peptide ABC transporter permease [Lachnospiraceae bacterium]